MPDVSELNFVSLNQRNRKICEDYILGFVKDCFPFETDIPKRADEMMSRHTNNKSLFLLEKNGEIVSIAAKAREFKNAAIVSLIYTPPSLRGKGYGSVATSLISEKLLNDGFQVCNLFTDLLNPISNSIYQKIGYVKIGESKHLSFKL